MGKLSNKVAIITGATSGIGKATALLFAEEGADVVTASTHKTFPGPNHGIVLGHNLSEELEKKLNSAVFPGVTSSHHLHEMAALAVTMAEWEIYGNDYAAQICRNAKALGQAMPVRENTPIPAGTKTSGFFPAAALRIARAAFSGRSGASTKAI